MERAYLLRVECSLLNNRILQDASHIFSLCLISSKQGLPHARKNLDEHIGTVRRKAILIKV